MLAPFPPVRPMIRLLLKLGTAEALRLAQLLVQPANTMVDQLFDGEAPRTLLPGNAMHADIPLDAPGSGVMGFLMTMLGQDGGWPVPVAGLGSADRSIGQARLCGRRANRVRSERFSRSGARGTGGRRDNQRGRTVRARRAVIADVTAPRLFCDMLPEMWFRLGCVAISNTTSGIRRW